MQFIAPETKRVFFCTCKRSKTAPLCDGSHKALPPDA
jgi:CDGSH-type Zn-finger protein